MRRFRLAYRPIDDRCVESQASDFDQLCSRPHRGHAIWATTKGSLLKDSSSHSMSVEISLPAFRTSDHDHAHAELPWSLTKNEAIRQTNDAIAAQIITRSRLPM
jgi:hypothetical protein